MGSAIAGAEVAAGTAAALDGQIRTGSVYCLIPPILEAKLREPLMRQFAANPDVEVLVERRRTDRRRAGDRRAVAAGCDSEQRRIRNLSGRRIGERRAPLRTTPGLPLPQSAIRFADRIEFVQRLEPSAEQLADIEDLRLVTQLQSGSDLAFEAIYHRYLSRLHVYARAALHDEHEAEDVAHEVLMTMLEAVPDYEVRGIPFRIWVFRVLRNQVRKQLAKKRRLVVEDPLSLHTRIDSGAQPGQVAQIDRHLFERIAENDFMERIERLSAQQRQVLVLRFLLGFELSEIGPLLGMSKNAAANLQYRGLGALRDRCPGDVVAELGAAQYAMQRIRFRGGVGQARRAVLHAFSW
jgi:RNA polymerase sigma-70 factor (ECF subfamily)